MDATNFTIRRETPADHRAVENLVREAFWNVYRPGCVEHFVLHRFRDDPAFLPDLSFVIEQDGRIVGENVFVRAAVRADDGGRDIPVAAMGPICVAPDCQRRGWGKLLLDRSLEAAAAAGVGAVFLEGNAAFYGKNGFRPASGFAIRYPGLPEGADASFFLAKELLGGFLDGVRGEYVPPEGYLAAEREPEAFERFDALFPPKEKLVLPGQLF